MSKMVSSIPRDTRPDFAEWELELLDNESADRVLDAYNAGR
jgi:hypothetical protein